MQYLQFGDHYLVEETITTNQPTAPAPVNHLWIIDRSGSMWDLISELIDDLQRQVRKIPRGDTISFGYFSSEGNYRFVTKGFKLDAPQDYDKFRDMLDSYRSTLALTCFSEILEDSYNVLEELSWISNQFSLWLLTDGYPVVRNIESEEKRIAAALKRINCRLVASQFVGYGDYYNKELMVKMAEWAGGSLIHCSELQDSSSAIERFIESMPNSPRIEVPAPADASLVFTAHNGVVSYTSNDEGKLLITPPDNSTEFNLYYISQTEPARGGLVELTEVNFYQEKGKSIFPASFAAAALLNQRGRGDLAIELMGAVGDPSAVNWLCNAFTMQENGAAEEALLQRFEDPVNFAWWSGFVKDCIPPFNAFCVLDLLERLMESDALFYPKHPDFRYKRIGRKAIPHEGYPKFEADPSVSCRIANLVWNESTLNLSVLVNIPGTVDLGSEAAAVGLPETFHTYIWNTYTIIRDGALHTTELPVSLPEPLWVELQEAKLIRKENEWAEGKIVTLFLDTLPLINRKIANAVLTDTAATDLARKAIEMEQWGAYLKVYKHLLKQLQPEAESLPDTFSDAQKQFLEAKGVTAKGFRPPTDKAEATDVYITRKFEVAVKGWSSLPKIEDVEAKVSGGKKLNAPTAAMAKALETYKAACELIPSDETRITVLKDYIQDGLKQQRRLRSDIQRAKFSVLLGRRWFKEFNSRSENSLVVDGHTVTFSEGIKEVKI